MQFELTAPGSKITPLIFLVKNVLAFLELVSGENVLIVHDVYLDSFPLIACLAVELGEPLQCEFAVGGGGWTWEGGSQGG